MSISKSQRFCYFLVAPLLVFAGVTAGAEVVFRLLGDQPSADLKGMYAPFGKGSYRLGQNVDTNAAWAAGYWSVATDSLGLRCDGARVMATEAGAQLGVLLLGDSQGFGHGVSFEQSLAGSTAILGHEAGWRIANASVGGHGAGNQFEIADWLVDGKGIRARHVVYLCTPNSVQYPESYATSIVGADGKLYSRELSGFQSWRASLESGAKQHTVVYGRLRDAVRNLNIGTRPVAEADPMLALYSHDPAKGHRHVPTVEFARKLKTLAGKMGGRAHVVYIPLTIEFDFQGIKAQAAGAGRSVDDNAAVRKLEDAAQEAGIGFFNLKPTLKKAADEGLPLRLRGDFHYSRELSVWCGRDLWGYLKKLERTEP
jgi:hypothetical protein